MATMGGPAVKVRAQRRSPRGTGSMPRALDAAAAFRMLSASQIPACFIMAR